MPNVVPNAMPTADAAPSQDQSAANDSADDLPAGTPLKGRIPLPTRRPHIAALTAVASNDVAANSVAANLAGGAMSSRIPLPRARPAAAPEPVSEPIPAYDPSQIH